MKSALSIKIAFAVLALSLASTAASEMKWFSYSEGMARAKAEKKPVIVDFFYGKGCPRCEKLQEYVYDDPAISKKMMDDFITIKIDLTAKLTKEEEALGKRFDFKDDCLLLFLDHNEELLKDQGGRRLCFIDAVDPEWFVAYLDKIKEEYKKKLNPEKPD